MKNKTRLILFMGGFYAFLAGQIILFRLLMVTVLTLKNDFQLFYFKKNYDKWIVQDGWKNKLQSLIKGPGWRPGSPWTGNLEEVPDVSVLRQFGCPTAFRVL